jgi:hypothetical protein
MKNHILERFSFGAYLRHPATKKFSATHTKKICEKNDPKSQLSRKQFLKSPYLDNRFLLVAKISRIHNFFYVPPWLVTAILTNFSCECSPVWLYHKIEREREIPHFTLRKHVFPSFSQFFIHYIGHKINNWPDVNLCFSAGAALSGAAHF